MKDATFSFKHNSSDSCAFASFKRIDGKIKMEFCFAKGNVVSLDAVRNACVRANELL